MRVCERVSAHTGVRVGERGGEPTAVQGERQEPAVASDGADSEGGSARHLHHRRGPSLKAFSRRTRCKLTLAETAHADEHTHQHTRARTHTHTSEWVHPLSKRDGSHSAGTPCGPPSPPPPFSMSAPRCVTVRVALCRHAGAVAAVRAVPAADSGAAGYLQVVQRVRRQSVRRLSSVPFEQCTAAQSVVVTIVLRGRSVRDWDRVQQQGGAARGAHGAHHGAPPQKGRAHAAATQAAPA
eukprot:1721139-Pyramimonas_sp.AAC.1